MTDNVYAIPDTARREDYENCEMERYMPDYRDRPRERAARADAYEDCDIQRPSLNSRRPVHQGSELGDHKERASSKMLILVITCFSLTMMGFIAVAVLYVLSQARWQEEISSLQGSLRNYQNVTDEDISELNKYLRLSQNIIEEDISELNKSLRYSQNKIEEDITDNKKHIAGLQRFSNTIPKNISDLNKSLRHSQNVIEEDISDLNKSLRHLQNAIEEDISDLNKSLRHSQNAIEEEIREIHERLTELQSNVSLYTCDRQGGLIYAGKCFITNITSSRSMTYDEAVAECAKHGAQLAEIHDGVQQTRLYDFTLTKMPAGRSYVYAWLGMEYKHSNSTLLYRSGMEKDSNQFQWDESFPSSSSSNKYMAIEVGDDGDSQIGIWNLYKSYFMHGVICEKET